MADAGGTGNDVACIADAFECDTVTFDDDVADASTEQVTTLVDIADHDLWSRDDNAFVVAVIEAVVKPVEDVCLDLLNLGLLLMNLLQILLNAALKILQ